MIGGKLQGGGEGAKGGGRAAQPHAPQRGSQPTHARARAPSRSRRRARVAALADRARPATPQWLFSPSSHSEGNAQPGKEAEEAVFARQGVCNGMLIWSPSAGRGGAHVDDALFNGWRRRTNKVPVDQPGHTEAGKGGGWEEAAGGWLGGVETGEAGGGRGGRVCGKKTGECGGSRQWRRGRGTRRDLPSSGGSCAQRRGGWQPLPRCVGVGVGTATAVVAASSARPPPYLCAPPLPPSPPYRTRGPPSHKYVGHSGCCIGGGGGDPAGAHLSCVPLAPQQQGQAPAARATPPVRRRSPLCIAGSPGASHALLPQPVIRLVVGAGEGAGEEREWHRNRGGEGGRGGGDDSSASWLAAVRVPRGVWEGGHLGG